MRYDAETMKREFWTLGHSYAAAQAERVPMRCPACHHQTVLQPLPVQNFHDVFTNSMQLGIRVCSLPDCQTLIFVVLNGRRLWASFPPELEEFDGAGVPGPILAVFNEGLINQSQGCYISAGIMVRKTLELLCDDRGAEGKNLQDRIKALRDKVTLSQELLDGADHIRMLGNDAAHVSSRNYDDVGKEEIEAAVGLTKEILRAVYQHKNLLAKLAALKKQPQP